MTFEDYHMTYYRIRQLFEHNGIKKRVLNVKPALTEGQKRKRDEARPVAFKNILKALHKKKVVIFMDEAIFTAGQVKPSIYFTPGEPFEVERKRLAFKAIAVAAGIDRQGNIHGLTVADKVIQQKDFMIFLNKIRKAHKDMGEIIVFLDNLPMHHTHAIRDHA